jgi:hypothetical protein
LYVLSGGVKHKNWHFTAFFCTYKGYLSAFKKQVLFACCSPVMSGVVFFGVIFSPQPAIKKPPVSGGFCYHFPGIRKMVYLLILCGF